MLEKIGVRSVKFSPDGELLASGDRQGNIRVHTLKHMEQIQMLEAHNSDVLDLEFTHPKCGKLNFKRNHLRGSNLRLRQIFRKGL